MRRFESCRGRPAIWTLSWVNVLVEASSQRLACLSTNISGVPELLTDGENGFVVPPEDPKALAAAMERAIRDPALRHRLGDAAEKRVREHFDHHSSIRQLTRLFEEQWQKEEQWRKSA